jgi:hypothetical protein
MRACCKREKKEREEERQLHWPSPRCHFLSTTNRGVATCRGSSKCGVAALNRLVPAWPVASPSRLRLHHHGRHPSLPFPSFNRPFTATAAFLPRPLGTTSIVSNLGSSANLRHSACWPIPCSPHHVDSRHTTRRSAEHEYLCTSHHTRHKSSVISPLNLNLQPFQKLVVVYCCTQTPSLRDAI